MLSAALGPTTMPSPTTSPTTRPTFILTYATPVDAALQRELEAIDTRIRTDLGMLDAVRPEGGGSVTAVGLLDLTTSRLAMIHPDRIEYAASVPKVGILLAYFTQHPEAVDKLDSATRHELGLMAKASSNEMASKFSHELSLTYVQDVLNKEGFYDASKGGGIWVGKHYGKDAERHPDPVGNHTHAATVRQLLRFWLLLDQNGLLSPAASQMMKDIFASPDIPPENIKFVKALAGRDRQILRKWGSWESWLHDTALITGEGRHYILVALTQHPRGDEYLERLALAVDDLFAP